MKKLVAAACILAGSHFAQVDDDAQARNRLTAALMVLQSAGQETGRNVDIFSAELLAVPERAHQPTRPTVTALARELVTNLAGRNLQKTAAARIATETVCALRSAGMRMARYKECLSGFEKSLADIGLSPPTARALANRLQAAGLEVRGPEDLPSTWAR